MPNYASRTTSYANSKKSLKERDKHYKEGKPQFVWHWSLTVLLIGGFIGGTALYFLLDFIDISTLGWWSIVLGIGGVAAAAQWRSFSKKGFIQSSKKLGLPFYLGYNVIGIGWLGTALLFVLAIAFQSDAYTYEHYRFVGKDPDYSVGVHHLNVILLEDGKYDGDRMDRSVTFNMIVRAQEDSLFEYRFSPSILGLQIKKGHRVIAEPFPDSVYDAKGHYQQTALYNYFKAKFPEDTQQHMDSLQKRIGPYEFYAMIHQYL